MLLLSNDDVRQVLTMVQAIEVLEEAFTQYALGNAVEDPRMDMVARSEGDYSKGIGGATEGEYDVPMTRHARAGVAGPFYFCLKTMKGIMPRNGPVNFGCAALRLNADILAYPKIRGAFRRQQIPAAPGGRYCGLVMLWRTETGEPICIFPDSQIEKVRVGCSNAIAAKYLARKNASVYGLIGAGWQAGAQLEAMCEIRPISHVKVWSPTEANREKFSEDWAKKLQRDIKAVDTLEEVVRGSDIVGLATNSLTPIIKDPALLEDGLHLTTISWEDIGREVFDRCDVKVVFSTQMTWPEDRRKNWFVPGEARKLPTYWVANGVQDENPEIQGLYREWYTDPAVIEPLPTLGDILIGRSPGRQTDREITYFWNNYGWGLQFAAVGAKVYELAKARGVGRELPTEWFTQETPG